MQPSLAVNYIIKLGTYEGKVEGMEIKLNEALRKAEEEREKAEQYRINIQKQLDELVKKEENKKAAAKALKDVTDEEKALKAKEAWHLLVDVWIPSYSYYRGSSSYQTLTTYPSNVPPFNQMLIKAESNTMTVNRILYWRSIQSSLRYVTDYSADGELWLDGDSASKPTRPNHKAGVHLFPEWGYFNTDGNKRLIFRRDQIHCGLDYQSVGGENDNPNLGKWGKIYIRNVRQDKLTDRTYDLP